MDLVARKKLNLEVLKRHDPNISDILDQSAHAVVYKFDTEKTIWEKLGYEGVIFLTQGKNAPYFGLYVLNRLSIENFSLHLTDFEEINLTDEFIIYQTSEGVANALWLYEKKDRERILAKILKLHEGIKSLPSQQQKSKTSNIPPENKVDILQMLNHGQPKTSPTPPSALQNAGRDLLNILSKPQQEPPMHADPTFPVHPMPPLVNEMPPRAIANGELIKPFYPPFVNMSPIASPNTNHTSRNSGTLLQALHGGLAHPPNDRRPIPVNATPPMPPMPPPPPMSMPLMPQHMLTLMGPEINQRFAARPLSKPEFIQQLLNMIQCDPTFFDALYENYKATLVAPSKP